MQTIVQSCVLRTAESVIWTSLNLFTASITSAIHQAPSRPPRSHFSNSVMLGQQHSCVNRPADIHCLKLLTCQSGLAMHQPCSSVTHKCLQPSYAPSPVQGSLGKQYHDNITITHQNTLCCCCWQPHTSHFYNSWQTVIAIQPLSTRHTEPVTICNM